MDNEFDKRKVEAPLSEGALLDFEISSRPWMAQKMDQIYRFSRQLAAINRLDALFENTARQVVEILQAKYCRVLLFQADGTWQCPAAFPAGDEHARIGMVEAHKAGTIYSQAAAKGHPTVLRRGTTPWLALERQFERGSRSGCVCLVPIHLETEAPGLLVIGLSKKSSEEAGFAEEKRMLAQYLAEQAGSAILRARALYRFQENQMETVLALSKAIELRDDHTGGHSSNMTRLAERVAAACRCSAQEIQTVRWAGMLHDIGKIGLPDAILRRPGPLDEQEWLIVRQHPDMGAEIVLMVSRLAEVADLIRSHHEHFNGAGYPRRLSGEQIPLGARILAVVDAYTAMTDGRAYRAPISHAEAMTELRRCAGTHFDPRIVEIFSGLFQ